MAEIERWLTARRIGLSDLAMLIFEAMHDPDIELQKEEADRLMASLITAFATGGCLLIASAVSRHTGYPIVAFRRPDGTLVHAAIVDPVTMNACDILGARPLTELRYELREAVAGTIRMTAEPPISADDMGEDQHEPYLALARGLPWMPLECADWKPGFRYWAGRALLLSSTISQS